MIFHSLLKAFSLAPLLPLTAPYVVLSILETSFCVHRGSRAPGLCCVVRKTIAFQHPIHVDTHTYQHTQNKQQR